MKNYILLLSLLFVFSSCLKLDDIAFINESINEYQLDDYDDDIDFRLDSSYSVEDIHFLTLNSEEFEIAAIYIGNINTISSDTIILYSHGQSLHIDYYWQRAKLLANCGSKNRFGVLMYDYRGYGLSEGSPTENGMYSDIRAAFKWLIDNGSSAERIVSYGFSLGSAPATDLMAFGHDSQFPSRLILESPFASTNFIAQESTIIDVPASFITTLEFDNTEKIKLVRQPFMWLHGIKDDYVAITNGEAIVANYAGVDSSYIRVVGANHGKNGVPQTMGFDIYLSEIETFLTSDN